MGKLHIIVSYALDKNLGKANNDYFRMIGPDDAICLIDYDFSFLLPSCFQIINEYYNRFPDKILTCTTNRIGINSIDQLHNKKFSNKADYSYHINIARRKEMQEDYTLTPITCGSFGGFMVLMSKKTWEKYPFKEDMVIIGIETEFFNRITTAGDTIWIMDKVYGFHAYRLLDGAQNSDHLK